MIATTAQAIADMMAATIINKGGMNMSEKNVENTKGLRSGDKKKKKENDMKNM